MRSSRSIFKIVFGLLLVCVNCTSNAASPLWTFQPLTATTLTLTSNQTATVQYLVTNQSRKSHTLALQSVIGINQATGAGTCGYPFTLSYRESCVLSLTINGNLLQGNVSGGPVVCQTGSQLQCYQPAAANILQITLVQTGIAYITSTTDSPAVLYGRNMNWLGNSPSSYIVFYCAGSGCNINQFSETPTGPITATSMQTDSGSWSGFSGAICPASEASYNSATCSNIFFTP